MNIKTIIYLVLILSFSLTARAQNFNINVLPTRVVYDNNQGFDLLLLFKYAELERKIDENFSFSLGVFYNREKEQNFLGGFRNLSYNVDPSLRYYFNKKNNMSGFYVGNGINYAKFSFNTNGRFASMDGSIIERNRKSEIININLNAGYKFVLIKNRFSIDFKLNQAFNLISKEVITTLISSGSEFVSSSNPGQNSIGYPFLDLKLGYRFGFKK